MHAEELENLTPDQLIAEANTCFVRANEENTNLGGGHERRLLFHLQAQFYLTTAARKRAEETAERDRRRNEEIAERDFRLERRVVWLIGAEIVLSIIFGVIGISEGWQQGKILAHMDTSSAATATAIQTARDSLKSLAAAQDAALKILQEEQNARLGQLAKKPKLVLYLENRPLKAGTHFTPRKETETSATFDLDLTNNGDATATDVLFHVSVSAKDVFVDPPFTEVPLPPDQTMRTFQAPSNLPIRPQSHARVAMTFHYPKGHASFDIHFLAETNDQPAVPLGSLRVTPQNSPN